MPQVPISLALIVAAIQLPVAQAPAVYTDAMYQDAVTDRGWSSPPYVLVTIVNGATGEAKTGCTNIGALGSAIYLEKGWPFDGSLQHYRETDSILRKQRDRRFVFNQPAALAGAGFFLMKQDKEACAFLRKGMRAFVDDRTRRTILGRPGNPK